MRFGPFPKEDLPKIEAALKKADLNFAVVNEGEDWFAEIADEELEKLDPDLENAGLSLGLPVPDFHGQDFVCPTCDHSQETAGKCPKDGTDLLEFSEYAAHKRKAAPADSYFFYFVMGLVVVGVAAYAIWG